MENQLVTTDANSLNLNSVGDNYFDVDFGGHLLARMVIKDGFLHVTDAMNGFGHPVDVNKVKFNISDL